jgi:membrane protein involved in D-alanine export
VTPYVDFDYFLFLLYPLSALVLLGALGRLGRSVVLIVSLAIVLFQYGEPLAAGSIADGLRPMIFLAAYAVGSIGLVLAYSVIRRRRPGRSLFVAAVAIALAPLVATKLYPLVRGSPAIAGIAGPLSSNFPGGSSGLFDNFGFLGISYITLRVLDAIIVLHDGVVKERPSASALASYLLFAPTISAGPIDRFQRFTAELAELPKRGRDYARDVEAGIHRVAQGFLYKFIIAYLIYRHALTPMEHRFGVLATVGYMYAFSLYLFFDFAGYSAFAIGVGHFFGVRVPENFNAPFLSRNFREMWDRWHITLSWWLRDHVYMRFMLAAARRRWFGGNRVRAHHVALLLTMSLMGCWHGLETRYVLYGFYQGLMLVLYDVADRWNKRRKLVGDGRLVHVASVLLTVNLFCFGLLIFSGRLFGHGG